MAAASGDAFVHPSLSVIMCPTALGTGRWQVHLLSYCYLAAGVFALWELARSIGGGYRTMSFRNVFLGLAAWAMLHKFFLMFVPLEPWHMFTLVFFVLFFPLYLQLMTWSLLVVFLARALYILQHKSRRVYTRLYPVAGAGLAVALLANITISAFTATLWRPTERKDFDRHVTLFAGSASFVLVTIVAVYGIRTYRLLARATLNEKRRRRNVRVALVASLYWAVFLVRGVWNVLYFFDVNPLQQQLSAWAQSNEERFLNYYFWAYMVFYGIIELLPMSAIIFTISAWLPRRRPTVITEAATAAAVATVTAVGAYDSYPPVGRRGNGGGGGGGGEKAAAAAPQKRKMHVGKSILAGGIAGGIEIMITYPTEFVKTQLQLDERATVRKYSGPINCASQTVKQYGPLGLYRGLAPLLYGSIPKSAVRFGGFTFFERVLKDDPNTELTRGKRMLAGLGAGVAEAVLAVCPMETVKVRFIDDLNRAQPQFRNFFHGVATIVRAEGFGGVYKGLFPTVLKQGSNQAIRFLVYGECNKLWQRGSERTQLHDVKWWQSMISGAVAGAASVYGNTPIDVIKTRMQGIEASKYRSTLHCAQEIYRNEGLRAFYKGTTPRLGRVCLDVGLVFTIYAQVRGLLDKVWKTD